VGALVLGRVSQDTISGGIADIGAFTTEPEFFALGMMWALIVGGVWQIFASTCELNVSATHSIIGAIVGFAMAFKGQGAVLWAVPQIRCQGPLLGYNPDTGSGLAAFSQTKQALPPTFTQKAPYNSKAIYLRGKLGVPIHQIYDPATCQVRTAANWIITADYLTYQLQQQGILPANAFIQGYGSSTSDGINYVLPQTFSPFTGSGAVASTAMVPGANISAVAFRTQWAANAWGANCTNTSSPFYSTSICKIPNQGYLSSAYSASQMGWLFTAPFTSTWDQINFFVNHTGVSLGTNDTDQLEPMKWQFQLATTNWPPGAAWLCNGREIFPTAKAPAAAWQFWYQASGTNPGICNVRSCDELPFPPTKGVLAIVLAWFFSPVLTAIASSILFLSSRHLVLRSENAYKRSFFVIPFLAFLTFWVDLYFVLTKGAAKILSRDAAGWTSKKAAWIAAAAAGGVSFFATTVVAPILYRHVERQHAAKVAQRKLSALEVDAEAGVEPAAAAVSAADAQPAADAEAPSAGHEHSGHHLEHLKHDFKDNAGEKWVGLGVGGAGLKGMGQFTSHKHDDTPMPEDFKGKMQWYAQRARDKLMFGLEVDIHDVVEEDELVAAIHDNAEVFDEKAEMVYSYMQVFSAMCVIFAHGAGEVGYMSGPLGAIFQIIRSGQLVSSTSPPIWTVIIGALGLVIGLGTYGYQVCRAVGTRLAKLTPSRGFSAELATSLIIMIASQYGLPTSSSQCITGGIIGIALCEGRKGLNLKFLFHTFMSWIWTLVLVALVTAFFFAQGAYAPSVQMARQIGYYEEALSARAHYMLTGYENMIRNSGYNTGAASTPVNPPAAATGATVPNLPDMFVQHLAATYTNVAYGGYYSYTPPPAGFFPGNKAPVIQTPPPWQLVNYVDTALALIEASVQPNPNGVNMCNGISGTGTNSYSVAKFPWSVKAAPACAPGACTLAGTNVATTGMAVNPCTTTSATNVNSYNYTTGVWSKGYVPQVDLTPVRFMGPSPYSPFDNVWTDFSGNMQTSANWAVERVWLPQKSNTSCSYGPNSINGVCGSSTVNNTYGQSYTSWPSASNWYPIGQSGAPVTAAAASQGTLLLSAFNLFDGSAVTGTVTLDQVAGTLNLGGTTKPCQQAPCNQQACNGAPCSAGVGTAYMG
jgi:phosphate/sulfate permease